MATDREEFDLTVFRRHLRGHGHDAEHLMLDELYCLLHNGTNELECNTEEQDAEWFARQIYLQSQPGKDGSDWDQADKSLWTGVAQAAIACTPDLCRRRAARQRAVAQAMKTILAGYWADDRRKIKAVE